MSLALSAPAFTAVDLGPQLPKTAYTFVCNECGRQHNSPHNRVPEGWTLIRSQAARCHVLCCPDCRLAAEQGRDAERPAPAFAAFLEKQSSGEFQIALLPETTLMRWLPLSFFLTPTQARDLAAQLIQLAALAEKPGAVPLAGGVE